MTEHVERKHRFCKVRRLDARQRMIFDVALDETNRRILEMRHVEHKSFGYIADILGYSRSQIWRRYKKSLEMLELD